MKARAIAFTALLALGLLVAVPSNAQAAIGTGCATAYAGASGGNAGALAAGATGAATGFVARQQAPNEALTEGVRLAALELTYYGTFLNAVRYVQSINTVGPFAATDQFILDERASIDEGQDHFFGGVNGFLAGSGNAAITAGEAVDAAEAYAGAQGGATTTFVACAV